jgi:lipoprotein-anchoring transpeptidase ErfK/SrfK
MAATLTQTAWREMSPPFAALLPGAMALGIAALATGLSVAPHRPNSAPVKHAVAAKAVPTVPTYLIKSRLPSAALNHGDWRWDESNAPATGPIFIAIDTASQTLTAYRGGYAIGVAVIVFGDERAPTPLGNFRVKLKDAHHWSKTYDAPMPHTLRLTDDGISIHGSEEISPDLASHGCVGLPQPFAKKLFGVVAVGDPVRITNGVFVKEGDAIPLPQLAPPVPQPLKDASPRSTRAI